MLKKYDAIIVGSGACGGWAALELTRAGMHVLMLEAGARVEPTQQFRHVFPYELDYRGLGKPGLLRRYAGSERNYRIMIDNVENPYTTSPETVYRWGRSRCLGGRTLHWARATDRMADYEFKAASRDGYGMDWAVSYADMKPYYDRIEAFIGVSGAREGFAQFPDGIFLPAMPPALQTVKLDIRTDAVVARVRMNREHRAQGVTYIERYTKKSVDVDAQWVILAASTLENTRLLLLSEKGGLANSSGTLGQYMMDQVAGGGVSGILPKLKGGPARLDDGKSAGITIPNFLNIDGKTQR